MIRIIRKMDDVSQTETDVNPSASAQQVISGGIPDLIRLSEIPTNMIQEVETDLLDPVVLNDPASGTGFCRFQLQNKGFLHSHSKVFLSLVPATGNADACPPLSVGIGSVIQKAVLKVGNQVINEISDWQNLHAVKSSLIANEINKEREMYLTGRSVSHRFLYDELGALAGRTAQNYVIDTGCELIGSADNLQFPEALNMDGTSAVTKAESPSYSVDLSDLFPFLKVHQLPLYMMQQPVSIELTWAPQGQRRVCVGSGGTAGHLYPLDTTEVKFCADYIFYGAGSEMSDYAEANRDLTFSFVDYRLNSASVTFDGTTAQTLVRNVGMANRMVTRVITTFARVPDASDTLLGGYSSDAPSKNADGVVDTFKYNLRYNDRFEFASDVENTARLFSLLTDAESVPFITREEYAHEGDLLAGTNATLLGRRQDTQLGGKFFYNSTRLTGGRVGQRGIELHVEGAMPTGAKTIRSYCEYLRVARLRNGKFELFNA